MIKKSLSAGFAALPLVMMPHHTLATGACLSTQITQAQGSCTDFGAPDDPSNHCDLFLAGTCLQNVDLVEIADGYAGALTRVTPVIGTNSLTVTLNNATVDCDGYHPEDRLVKIEKKINPSGNRYKVLDTALVTFECVSAPY